MSLISNSVEHPIKVYVAMILIVLFGLIALGTMPIQLVPEVSTPTLTVTTMWPGATPQEIETEIIQEQEEALQGVEGVIKMTSESKDSTGVITLEFPVGTSLDAAITLVNSRLQQVKSYPENADRPVISTANASDQPIGWFVLTQAPPTQAQADEFLAKHGELKADVERAMRPHNPGLQMYRLRELAKKHPEVNEILPAYEDVPKLRKYVEDVIETRLEKVPGVSAANIFGGEEQELHVIVDAEQLAVRKITLPQLRDALRMQNADVSGGDIWEGKRRYIVRTLGRFRTTEQVANTVIVRENDQPIYVRDVARVELSHQKPSGVVRLYKTPVIAFNVVRRTGVNVLQLMERINAAVSELNEGTLALRKLRIHQVYDETEYIHSSVGLVVENIWQGAALTFIVLLLFLRNFRSTIVVFISIFVSMVGMFIIMRLLGRTLNVPALAGIAFAVGMLVDNFIVVLENSFRHRSEGLGTLEATIKGAGEVWGAVLTSTLANLAVFIPVLFVQDQAGQLFRDIALAAAAALVMSLLVALLFVPAATAWIFRTSRVGKPGELSRLAALFSPITSFVDRLGNAFVTLVVTLDKALLHNRFIMFVTSASFVAATFFLTWLLFPKVEYLPSGNRNLVFGIVIPPPAYNLEQMTEIGTKVEDKLEKYWNVDGEEAAEMLKKNPEIPPIDNFFYVSQGPQVFIGMSSYDPLQASKLIPVVMSLSPEMPGSFAVAFQMSLFEQGLSAGRSIDVEITGPDVRKLVALGGRIFGQAMPVLGPNIRPIPNLDLSSPEMVVTPLPDQARDNGFANTNDVGYMVNVLVDGAYTTDYYLDADKIDLVVRSSTPYNKLRTEELRQQKIATPNGDLIDLAAIADIRLSSSPEQINRRERQRAITIQITPPENIPLESAIEMIQNNFVAPLRAEKQIDDGLYEIKMGGTADKLRLAWEAMKWNLLLALAITYLVMAALFESWLYPFVIMLSVPLGAVGGLVGLQLLNLFGLPQSLDVLTMLGFIILIGTVVNNPILIIEQTLNLIDEGMVPRAAMLESVRTRIRPIFMTTFIALFGLLPLVISPGAGSELYRGIGAVLLGGLVVSTLFTLFLVPCLFILALELREMIGNLLAPRLAMAAPAGVPSNSTPPQPIPVAEDHGLDLNQPWENPTVAKSANGHLNGNGAPHHPREGARGSIE